MIIETDSQSAERYKNYFEHSLQGIYRTEFDRPVDISLPVEEQIDSIYQNAYMAECNEALIKIYGLSSVDSLIGTRLIDAHGGKDNPVNRDAFRRFVENGYISREDETIEYDVNGNQLWFLSNTIGVVENGMLVRLWGTAIDITSRKKAEIENKKLHEQLYQLQKMEAVGQLAGSIAHEFNNILGIIVSAVDIAKSGLDNDALAHEELNTISDSVKRGCELTNKLLTYARKGKLEFKGVHAIEIVEELKAMLVRTTPEGIRLEVDVEENAILQCDQNQMLQALINVCNNAVDAMSDGGVLSIESKMAYVDNSICDTCGEIMKEGRYCLIQVSDTGAGISKNIRDKVFEPFFTTKDIGKGAGLGLSVALGIVLAHDGHVHLYSEEGRGTCIKFYMPLSEEAAAEDVRPTMKTERGNGETVLVVDDEYILLSLTKKSLKNRGYNVYVAGSAEEAIEIYRAHGKEISVVVTDLIMPEVGGIELYNQVKSIREDARIIISSGFNNIWLTELMEKDDGARFVQKPYEINKLCGLINELISMPAE